MVEWNGGVEWRDSGMVEWNSTVYDVASIHKIDKLQLKALTKMNKCLATSLGPQPPLVCRMNALPALPVTTALPFSCQHKT